MCQKVEFFLLQLGGGGGGRFRQQSNGKTFDVPIGEHVYIKLQDEVYVLCLAMQEATMERTRLFTLYLFCDVMRLRL